MSSSRRRPRRPLPPTLPDVVSELVEPIARSAADPMRRIALVWGRICGAPLNRHIHPLRIEGRVLHVGADGPEWRDAVFHERSVLVRRIRRYAPSVERIWLHTRPVQPAPRATTPSAAALTPRTEGIEDPALRAAMESMLAAATARDDEPAESGPEEGSRP